MSQFDRLLGLVRPTSCNRGAVMLTAAEALRKLMQEVEVEEAHDRI